MQRNSLRLAGCLLIILASCHSAEFEEVDLVPNGATGSDIQATIVVTLPIDAPIAKVTRPLTPFPDYLLVYPKPSSNYTMAEYEILAPSLGWGSTVPGICAIISPENFLEPGDFPQTAEEWLAQVHLVVDDTVIAEFHSLFLTDHEGITMFDRKTGAPVWKEPPGSPLRVCYEVPLEVGEHLVSIVVEKTFGEQSPYTWSFTITE